ncbi:MAG: Hsp20/alpha crystallin family protein [Saprospiraceae bacterium]|nr:Hsp20/alpha crystallin family protein [Saprospiraceae bacterium]
MTNIIIRPTGKKVVTGFPHLGNFGEAAFRNPVHFATQEPGQYVTKPASNILEDENQFNLEIAIPGVEKENVQIELNKNILTVSGSNTPNPESVYRLREFNFTQFKRTFRMPETADMDQVEATFVNGILKITVAKLLKAEPKKIQVK